MYFKYLCKCIYMALRCHCTVTSSSPNKKVKIIEIISKKKINLE